MSINIEEQTQLLPSLCLCSPAAPCSSTPHPAWARMGIPALPWAQMGLWGLLHPVLRGLKASPAPFCLAAGQGGMHGEAGLSPNPSRRMGVLAKPEGREPPGCPRCWDLAGQGAASLTLLQPNPLCNPLRAPQGMVHLASTSPKPLALARPWQRWLAWAAVCEGRAFEEAPGQISHSPNSTKRRGLFRI